MAVFEVRVTRVSTHFTQVEVEAKDEEAALEAAEEIAREGQLKLDWDLDGEEFEADDADRLG